MNIFSGRKTIRSKEQGIPGRSSMEQDGIENTAQEEDVLLEQINEWKKKGESLQRVLAVREQRVQELGKIISDREEKVKELDVAIESRTEAADQLITGVAEQIQELMQVLDKQLKQSGGNLEQQEELKTAFRKLNEKLDGMKFELGDRIHTENVKCYRNIKGLFTDLDGKLAETELGNDSMEKIRKSFKGWKFFSFFAFADFILILVYILYSMGLFTGLM